jgi:ABC-type Fe3+-hydroxamate transport system substrate-binding protein
VNDLPRRIVSLCPSLTEALFALGAGGRVVGVTDWCVHPKERLEGLPRVGGTKTPDLEAIFALRPDLVVVNEEENRIADVEAIRERGIATLETFPRTALEAASTMRAMGRALGLEGRGEAIAREIESARAEVAAASGARRVPLLCLVWRSPYIAVNRDTYIHDLLDCAGARNCTADREERYPRLLGEEVVAARAEAILLTSEPYPFKPIHVAEVRALTGLESGNVVLADGELLSWYGPRTPEGLRYAGRLVRSLRGRRGDDEKSGP